jgi:hypothetical protein
MFGELKEANTYLSKICELYFCSVESPTGGREPWNNEIADEATLTSLTKRFATSVIYVIYRIMFGGKVCFIHLSTMNLTGAGIAQSV